MKIETNAFLHQGEIPKQYTCEGDDVSPPLTIAAVPANARSLVLIVDDPDAPDPAAPKMTWVHWVLYDLPATTRAMARGATAQQLGARDGINDWKRTGYGGPCPPIGKHRYFFRLMALDTTLGDLGRPTRQMLDKAMADHVVARAELIGLYQKQGGTR